MNNPTIVLLVILVLWSLAGVIWFQKRHSQESAGTQAAGWVLLKAGPVVWGFMLLNKLRR